MEIELSSLEGKPKFLYCSTCGNLIEMVNDSKNIPVCCGKTMKQLIPNSTEANEATHIPVIAFDSGKLIVSIGDEPHPMREDHYIHWVEVQTSKGTYRRNLTPNSEPTTTFYLDPDEDVLCVFAYCNKHGLWMTII